MELHDVLAARRSVRSYLPRPVERRVLEELIRTATLAPSAMNSQPWAFGIIEGAERLRELSHRVKRSVLHTQEHDPELARYRDWLENPAFNVFYDAPALILVCARPSAYDPVGACAMAAHTLMLAARDKGLGTCWIGFAEVLFRSSSAKTEFGIPPEYRVVAPVIVGYPAGDTDPTPRNEPEILF